MVPVGTQTIAFGPLCPNEDGTGGVVIELLYKEDTAEFFGYHQELPMAFKLSTNEARKIAFHPATQTIKKVFCGKYPND
jgi:hypothetical protein